MSKAANGPNASANMVAYTSLKSDLELWSPELSKSLSHMEQIRSFAANRNTAAWESLVDDERKWASKVAQGDVWTEVVVTRIANMPFSPIDEIQVLRLEQLSLILEQTPSLAKKIANIAIDADKPWGKDYRPDALMVMKVATEQEKATGLSTIAYAAKLVQAANQQPCIKAHIAALHLLTRACEIDPTIAADILPDVARHHSAIAQDMREFLRDDEKRAHTRDELAYRTQQQKALDEACRAALSQVFRPLKDIIERIITHRYGGNPSNDLPVAQYIVDETRAHLPHLTKHALRLFMLAQNSQNRVALPPPTVKRDSLAVILATARAATDVGALYEASWILFNNVKKHASRPKARPNRDVYKLFDIPGLKRPK